MSSLLPAPSRWAGTAHANRAWLIALAGFAAMYLPVYWWAANGIWQSDEQAHGAIVFVVSLWLFWNVRTAVAATATRPTGWGWPVFVLGLLVYMAGRAFNISIFEMASQILVIGGALLLMKGWQALRAAWFPLFYLVFMIPLPGIFVDAVTGPLKQFISDIVVSALYSLGYPIARSGVIISIGQYQLLVADACSGLHSMFSLSALGTLFMYIMGRKSLLHNVIMLASILPIAFLANIVRVIILVLVTYYLGDEAGQGFLHGTAGMVLMMVALLTFFLLDAVLVAVLRFPRARSSTSG